MLAESFRRETRGRSPLGTFKHVAGVLALLGSVGWAPSASGEAAPDRARSGAYYGVHGAVTLGLAGTGLLLQGARPSEPRGDPQWFPGDTSVREHWSPAAIELSNVALAVTVSAPVFAELGRGFDYRLLNAGVVYSETLAASLALNSLAKIFFARPRPYTHGPGARDPSIDDPPERYVSFYSGHSSLAFASAVAGSYLFAEGARDEGSRIAFWATELTFAAATANLRVVAGKHYYSDVIVGALVGIGLGIGGPLIHGASYAPRPAEYLAAASGVVLGTAVAQLAPLKNLAKSAKTANLIRGLKVSVHPRGSTTVAFEGAF
jgi:membrane-associated phospholipid phosphatase